MFYDDVGSRDLTNNFFTKLLDNEELGKDWILFNTPLPMVSVLVVYFLVVFHLGPKFMSTRKPYELKPALRVYNIAQVFYNGFIFYGFITNPNAPYCLIKNSCSYYVEENTRCGTLGIFFVATSWHYLVLKMLDLLDTVFMVLRKKNSHITLLHVYHHVAMVLVPWSTFVYFKTYQSAIPALINTVVHAIMYSYYFLATFEQVKKYLWWKKHLTKIQLGQFVVILAYFCYVYYNDCQVPRLFTYVQAFNVFVIMVLFIDFYIKAYIHKTGENKDGRTQLKIS